MNATLVAAMAAAIVIAAAGWYDAERRCQRWQRQAERHQRRAEEADAWADEYQRASAAVDAECNRLRERLAVLTELYGESVRRLLAYGWAVHVAPNVERRRGGRN